MLETIGLDAEVTRAAARWATVADASLGRVSWVDRGLVSVLTDAGARRASVGGDLLGRMARDPHQGPTPGDWCLLRDWPDHRTTLEQILPRRTCLVADTQVLCANADLVALLVTADPLPQPARLERQLAVARHSGARPLVVLTTEDLRHDDLADQVAAANQGVDVLTVSARTGVGVEELRDRVGGRLTLALLGAAGQGRSSLVRALVGADLLPTRAAGTVGRPRHRWVRRGLVPLPGGGAVVDTPDLRSVGVARPGPHATDQTRP